MEWGPCTPMLGVREGLGVVLFWTVTQFYRNDAYLALLFTLRHLYSVTYFDFFSLCRLGRIKLSGEQDKYNKEKQTNTELPTLRISVHWIVHEGVFPLCTSHSKWRSIKRRQIRLFLPAVFCVFIPAECYVSDGEGTSDSHRCHQSHTPPLAVTVQYYLLLV